jgi:hypothetical protein
LLAAISSRFHVGESGADETLCFSRLLTGNRMEDSAAAHGYDADFVTAAGVIPVRRSELPQ